jgi:hypothetical protein
MIVLPIQVVTLDGSGLDALQAVLEPETAQGGDASRLKELTDDSVWLAEVPFHDDNASSLFRQR